MLDGRKYEIFLQMERHNRMIFTKIFEKTSLSASMMSPWQGIQNRHGGHVKPIAVSAQAAAGGIWPSAVATLRHSSSAVT